jgi:hypothetical protein
LQSTLIPKCIEMRHAVPSIPIPDWKAFQLYTGKCHWVIEMGRRELLRWIEFKYRKTKKKTCFAYKYLLIWLRRLHFGFQ